MIFADTSGLYAAIDEAAARHAQARIRFQTLLERDETIVTTNYVVIEFLSIVQRRLGMEAVNAVVDNLLLALTIAYVDEHVHKAAVDLFIHERRRGLSLVDCSSIVFMRRSQIRQAFAFERDFQRFGIGIS
jgi:predicted nucleic acid-binding protein